eukprot:jgi/Chlat1/1310/Chrsp118S01715
MMSPEMVRLASEQMARMRPEDLRRMQEQVMSMDPATLRMAQQQMGSMRPEDFNAMSDVMRGLSPDQMAAMSSAASAGSPPIAGSSDAYTYANKLKEEGNKLHNAGQYSQAIEKYAKAQADVSNLSSAEAVALRKSCLLNLASCYLKTKQFGATAQVCTEVLNDDHNNLKALYRRGQAYLANNKIRPAIADLERAHKLSPDDETVLAVYNEARAKLTQDAVDQTDELQQTLLPSIADQQPAQASVVDERQDEANAPEGSVEEVEEAHEVVEARAPTSTGLNSSESTSGGVGTPFIPDAAQMREAASMFGSNPELVRMMSRMMSNMEPEVIAAMSGGRVTSQMAQQASTLMQSMPPEALQTMMQSTMGMQPPASTSAASNTSIASSLQPQASTLPQPSPDLLRAMTRNGVPPSMEEMRQKMQADPSMLTAAMSDPNMMSAMNEMMKNMSPEAMVQMSEQMGMKLSPEMARKVHDQMSTMRPEDMERMMKVAAQVQKVAVVGKKAKDFLLGRAGLVIALVVLLLGVLLHWYWYR